nr:hypothetical protein [Mycobacterium leprae]
MYGAVAAKIAAAGGTVVLVACTLENLEKVASESRVSHRGAVHV